MSLKKTFFVVILLAIFVLPFLGNTAKVQAITVDEIRTQIVALQQQIAQLQKQLAEIEGGPEVWCYDFKLNLKYGMAGTEVRALQTALEKEGFYKKTVTGDFDEYTGSAVVGFQEKYKGEILTPWGLEHGTGYVGKTTLAKLNTLFGCGQNLTCTQEGGIDARSAAQGGGCCSGLSAISPAYTFDSNCNIIASQQHIQACTYCGNGVCGKGENQCNCPQDCKEEKLITVLSPNGGEQWVSGNTYSIKWSASAKIAKVDIYVQYLAVGRREIPADVDVIAKNVVASDGQYNWTAIGLSGNYKISIQTTPDWGSYAIDQSDNYFSIVSSPVVSAITVISPNGGEKWTAGQTYTIKWNAPDATRVVIDVLDQSTGKVVDDGIPAVLSNTGSYQWTIPTTIAPGTYKVKAYVCPSSLLERDCANLDLTTYGYDESDNYFSIISATVSAPIINNITPSQGYQGIDRANLSIFGKNFTGAGDFSGCGISPISEGGFQVVSCKVISDTQIDAQFSISSSATAGNRFITVQTPKGGKSNAVTFTVISSVSACTDSDGGKDYFVKGTVSDAGKSYTDYCLSGYNLKEYFCLQKSSLGLGGVAEENYFCSYSCQNGVCKKGITVTSPSWAVKWAVGGTYNIAWTSIGVDRVNIELENWEGQHAGGPLTWIIAENISAALKTYLWTIPSNIQLQIKPGSYYMIRIVDSSDTSSYNLQIADNSDYFSITEPVTCAREEKGVRCGGYFYEDYCEILPDGTGYADVRKCNAPTGGDCSSLVNIDRTFCPYGCQSGVCKLEKITVTYPNGGEEWFFGETREITWTAPGMNNAYIYLWFPDGGTCKLADVPASQGKYSVKIDKDMQCPNIPSKVVAGQYKILIYGDTEDYKDSSDSSFSIKEKSITIISPNGGETLTRGQTYTIRWNAPTATRVVIDVLDQATGKVVSVSTQIPAVLSNTGSYQWTIPSAMPAGNYKVKAFVCPASFLEIDCANLDLRSYGYDESDNYFSITGQ